MEKRRVIKFELLHQSGDEIIYLTIEIGVIFNFESFFRQGVWMNFVTISALSVIVSAFVFYMQLHIFARDCSFAH